MLIKDGQPVPYVDDPNYFPGAVTCSDCKFAAFVEDGYSSYTVEGRTFVCGKFAHPEDDFDSWYEIDPRLNFAAQCPEFSPGVPIRMDVERDEEDYLTQEQMEIWIGLREAGR